MHAASSGSIVAGTDGSLPLAGVTVIVTRAADRSDALQQQLAVRGAQVVPCALTRTDALPTAAIVRALQRVASYDWVVFTSATGITSTLAIADAAQLPQDLWRDVQVAVVGSTTHDAAQAAGIAPELIPEQFQAQALVNEFAARGAMHGQRVLYPAAMGASDVVESGLRALGAVVERIDVYATVPVACDANALRRDIGDPAAAVVTLAAPSAVSAWCALVPALAPQIGVVSIGPVTTAAALDAGLRVVAEAAPSTVAGLVDAVCAAVQDRRTALSSSTLMT
jgi:uroporphyrinogen III methyltransferase / synthase